MTKAQTEIQKYRPLLRMMDDSTKIAKIWSIENEQLIECVSFEAVMKEIGMPQGLHHDNH